MKGIFNSYCGTRLLDSRYQKLEMENAIIQAPPEARDNYTILCKYIKCVFSSFTKIMSPTN